MAEENFRWLDGLLYNSRVWRERDCSQTGSSTGGRVMRNSDGASTDHTCSLKPPWAALEAALAAAACTVLLDMTPDANSCWALSKLAPVVRYSAWIYSGCRDEKGEMRARFQRTVVGCTFLNMNRDMAAREVKRTATMIIMTPTGVLLFRQLRAEIHPLWMATWGLALLDGRKSRKQMRFLIDVRSPHLVPQLVMPIHWIT